MWEMIYINDKMCIMFYVLIFVVCFWDLINNLEMKDLILWYKLSLIWNMNSKEVDLFD